MQKVKSINLSISDLANLLSINDPEARREALNAIIAGADNPESIPEQSSGAAGPILDRIRRKAIAQSRAKERAKARKSSQSKKIDKKSSADKVPMIPINESTARRFLWLKQHMGETFDNLLRIFRLISDNLGHPNQMYTDLENYLINIRKLLRPLMSVSSNYLRMPRQSRPTALPIAL